MTGSRLPWVLLGWLLAALSTRGATPTADGLYAVFRVNRGAAALGEFACRLEFEKVPRTVANFVGLAEGSWPFVDDLSGHAAKRPFYDGIVFHRVVPGFVIQAGSPNGQGTDGPGYTFRDEFNSSLRHSKAGILSMANSGPHSNGSQFFVTLAPTAWLNDLHSVFGEVVDGMNVVTNVAQGDVIAGVTILRNGAAARAFVPSGQGLPESAGVPASIVLQSDAVRLNYSQTANSEFFVYHSDRVDAKAWAQVAGQEMLGTAPVASTRDVTAVSAGKPAKFYEVVRVQYPDPIHTPATVASKLVRLTDTGGFVIAFSLSSATSGTYTFTQGASVLGPNPVSSYSWTQEAYRGRLVTGISGLAYGNDPVVQASVNLLPLSPTNGTYSGSLGTATGQSVPIKGTFGISGL
jgi:cyclophilin family peptidyl-prolyl cis-trans isomerase